VTRPQWLARAGVLVALGLVAGLLVAVARDRALHHHMMVSDPDTIPSSPTLFRFAAAEGHPAYRRHCAECHGADGQGDRTRGAPSLADSDWLYGSGRIGEIEWIITHGIRAADPKTWNLAAMPAYGTAHPSAAENIPPLLPGQIRDVVEFLIAAGGRNADAVAAARGAQIFHSQGGCTDCHGADARGDPGIGAPNLTDAVWLTGDGSREAIFTIIARGRNGVCPAWGSRLDAATIRGLAVYVYTLSHASELKVAR
jgi:cytochrome c oxidase cbb3-type subunit 3